MLGQWDYHNLCQIITGSWQLILIQDGKIDLWSSKLDIYAAFQIFLIKKVGKRRKDIFEYQSEKKIFKKFLKMEC